MQDYEKLGLLVSDYNSENIKVDTDEIRPRKSDITIEKIALAWWST